MILAAPLEPAVHIDWTAVSAAAVAVIGAISIAAVTIIGAISRVRRETAGSRAAVLAQLEAAAKNTGEIHDAVNGTSRANAEKLERVENRLAELHREMSRLQESRLADAKLREARAETPPTAPPVREEGG